MDIGVPGGTFDPVHLGHLSVAGEVMDKLGLDRVIFVPAGQPWLKADRCVWPAAHRLEMVSLAIDGAPRFEVSAIDIDRPGPTYTVDTVSALRQELGTGVNLFFLLGSDALYELPRWKEPSRLFQMCRLAAFSRPGTELLPNLSWLEKAVPGVSQHIVFVEVSPVDISATQVRRQAALGASLQGLVPPAVERYILEHGLYRD